MVLGLSGAVVVYGGLRLPRAARTLRPGEQARALEERRPRLRIGTFGSTADVPLEWLLYQPKAVATANEPGLYILDAGNQRIVEVDQSGRYVAEIGSAGLGPGELATDPEHGQNDLAVTGSHVAVLQMPTRRVSVFTKDGTHHKTFAPIRAVGALAMNEASVFLAAVPRSMADPTVLRYSLDGDLQGASGSPLYDPGGGRRGRTLNRQRLVACEDGLPVSAYEFWPMVRRYGSGEVEEVWLDMGMWTAEQRELLAVEERRRRFGEDVRALPEAFSTRQVVLGIGCGQGPGGYVMAFNMGIVQTYSQEWEALDAFRVVPPDTPEFEGRRGWILSDVAALPGGKMICGTPIEISEVWCFDRGGNE